MLCWVYNHTYTHIYPVKLSSCKQAGYPCNHSCSGVKCIRMSRSSSYGKDGFGEYSLMAAMSGKERWRAMQNVGCLHSRRWIPTSEGLSWDASRVCASAIGCQARLTWRTYGWLEGIGTWSKKDDCVAQHRPSTGGMSNSRGALEAVHAHVWCHDDPDWTYRRYV